MPWHIVEGHEGCPEDRPWAVVKDDDGKVVGCHPSEQDAKDHLAALYANEDEEPEGGVAEDGEEPESAGFRARVWHGVLLVEGEPSSDGRVFTSLTWRQLPLALQWQKESSHGGVPIGGEVIVGRIDVIERDGDVLRGSGVIDLDSDDGAEVVRLIENGMLKGLSIEAALCDGTVEYDEENDLLLIDGAEIGSVAIVPFPAFRDAVIELGDEVQVEQSEPVLAASGPDPDAPPREWFDDPRLDRRMGLHVEGDRIYGHIYGWGECHRGMRGCVTIPRGGRYDYIVSVDGRGVRCADGSFVQTGPLCISADHADIRLGWMAAKDHYAHTGLAVADVVCGEDDHGIWIAGAIRPGVSAEMRRALTASAPSGDWRMIGGRLELVAVLMVNTPGYPAIAASYSGGDVRALIVRGPAPQATGCACGGASPGMNEILERLTRFEAMIGQVVARLRAEQAAQIASELETLAAGTEAREQPRRRLAEMLG